MWSAIRAEAAHRELTALAGAGLDVLEVHAHALAVIGKVVPFDAACLGAVDPDTMALSSGVTFGFEPSATEAARFTEIEFGGLDPNSFSLLADRKVPVLVDGGSTSPARRRDLRYHELGKLIGFQREARLTCMTDGVCWAVGDLYRSDEAHPFSEHELEFLTGATHLMAVATRRALHVPADGGAGLVGGLVLVADGSGMLTGMSEAARDWIGGLDALMRSRFDYSVQAAVALVRRAATSASTRLRIGGEWAIVHASPLQLGQETSSIAVTIERASVEQVADLVFAAHGLSRREREVCREVLAGHSTRQIAEALFVGQHTVQDHLKSIFAKVGVRSRRELVAALA